MRLERLGEFKVLTLRETPAELWTVIGDTPEKVAEYCRSFIKTDARHNGEVESLYVVHLSTRRKIMGYSLISTGTLDTILVHPREVFRPAIVAVASAIVLLHNHPSGDPTPSEADIKVTRDLVRAGQLLKIDVLDHLIMGCARAAEFGGTTKDYASLRELGYFTGF